MLSVGGMLLLAQAYGHIAQIYSQKKNKNMSYKVFFKFSACLHFKEVFLAGSIPDSPRERGLGGAQKSRQNLVWPHKIHWRADISAVSS